MKKPWNEFENLVSEIVLANGFEKEEKSTPEIDLLISHEGRNVKIEVKYSSNFYIRLGNIRNWIDQVVSYRENLDDAEEWVLIVSGLVPDEIISQANTEWT